MRPFTKLISELDVVSRAADRVAAMRTYFEQAPAADAAWAVQLLKGERPRRVVNARELAVWAAEEADTPHWLFRECRATVGDLAETAALLLPDPSRQTDLPLHAWIEQRLLPLAGEEETVRQREVAAAWRELDAWQRFVWNRLLMGTFRPPVTRAQLVRALAGATGADRVAIAHGIHTWEPTVQAYAQLAAALGPDPHVRPRPFTEWPEITDQEAVFNALPLHAVWLWGGERAQLVRRGGRTFIWSHAGELLTDRLPELADAAALLPDGTVLEGELVAWSGDRPLPDAQLQRRLQRVRPGRAVLAEAPVVMMVHSVHPDGTRSFPVPGPGLLSTRADAEAALRRTRDLGATALLLQLDPPAVWRPPALTVLTVLMYAARADDYTFGVWSGGELVPLAKTSAGLNPAELRRLESWARRNTVEKFGPVRSLPPVHVFELAFDDVQPSPRHRSGVVLTAPRVIAWRADLQPQDAASLDAFGTR